MSFPKMHIFAKITDLACDLCGVVLVWVFTARLVGKTVMVNGSTVYKPKDG